MIKKFLIISVTSYLLLLVAVGLFHPEFSACTPDSLWCSFMYWSTESAGRTSSFVIVILTSIVFGLTANSIKDKLLIMGKSLLVLIILLSAMAYVNEHYIKGSLRIARPSHTFIFKESKSKASLDSVYSLVISGRRSFLKEIIKGDTIHFKNIDPRVLDHWVEEAGYSFPSGHSLNAFMIGTIMAFAIFRYQGSRIKIWSFIPLLWAVLAAFSRVAIGAHTALDVSGGAALGLIITHVLLFIPLTRKLILPQTKRFVDADQK